MFCNWVSSLLILCVDLFNFQSQAHVLSSLDWRALPVFKRFQAISDHLQSSSPQTGKLPLQALLSLIALFLPQYNHYCSWMGTGDRREFSSSIQSSSRQAHRVLPGGLVHARIRFDLRSQHFCESSCLLIILCGMALALLDRVSHSLRMVCLLFSSGGTVLATLGLEKWGISTPPDKLLV